MNNRELADLIDEETHVNWFSGGPAQLADAILAAGYSRPRTVSTVAELDALPDMTVVRSKAGSIVNIVSGRAYIFGTEGSAPASSLALPASVLYEPEGK